METPSSSTDTTGLLLSGGLDSCILLGRLLAEGRGVQPFYVRSQLRWEEAELAAVRAFSQAMNSPRLEPLVVLNLPLNDLYGDHWSVSGRGVPGAETPDEAVYLPGRNALLAIKPVLWCAMHGVEELALAVLAANPFSDATAKFFGDFASALHQATGSRVEIMRPFARFDKMQVMRLAGGLPLELTFSCIDPAAGLHCGRCNKCAERQHAFQSIGIMDPTKYAVELSTK
jgi:7-cyano-7-deazaguanine synthase